MGAGVSVGVGTGVEVGVGVCGRDFVYVCVRVSDYVAVCAEEDNVNHLAEHDVNVVCGECAGHDLIFL